MLFQQASFMCQLHFCQRPHLHFFRLACAPQVLLREYNGRMAAKMGLATYDKTLVGGFPVDAVA